MKLAKLVVIFPIIFAVCIVVENVETRSVQYPIRSDVVVTNWPENKTETEIGDDAQQPGWMRRQLMKFGQVASRVGNAMGGHATKIASAVDKVCEIVKTIIPLLAAICHVGQFKFCAATTEAPAQLYEALSPAMLDLNVPDK